MSILQDLQSRSGNICELCTSNTTLEIYEVPLTVTVEQSSSQLDPTNAAPIDFSIIFNNGDCFKILF